MKSTIICAFLFASVEAFAGVGPNSLGDLSIGMSKSEYVTAIGISPVICNDLRDKDGKVQRSEIEYLTPDRKTLCFPSKTGSIENIQIEGLSYDAIEANYESSTYITTIGHSSKAIFFNDRLISLEIYVPKVNLETLTTKYGNPKMIDQRKIETCKNKIGNEFKNNVGNLDAVWTNGEVRSIFRDIKRSPRETCTDGYDLQYYILEDPRQLKLIENAIGKYRKNISKESAKDSKF